MVNLLAIDTSGASCSAALIYNQEVFSEFTLMERQQANQILPMIDRLLMQAKVSLNQLDALAFSCGPGSFTGIRLAASVIQGLAYACNLPVVAISTLQILAQGAYRALDAKNVLVAIDARMDEVYWGAYQLASDGLMHSSSMDQRCKPALIEPLSLCDNWLGIGDGWQTYAELLRTRISGYIEINANCYPDAKDLAILATTEFLAGNLLKPENALPTYFHEATSWKKQLNIPKITD